ncbi:MAG: FHA domain-containing protein [Aggregatilineales bacterium]
MAAFPCLQCGHTNPHGALYCEECFALLLDTHPVPSRTVSFDATAPGTPPSAQNSEMADRFAHIGKLNPHTIAIYVSSRSEPLIVVVVQQAILGRLELHDAQVRVDLSQYGAIDKGVSRQHAVLKRVNNRLVVEDMGSSNGTWLNDTPLQPYQPAPITSGARLRLGQLEVEIYLPE